MIPDYKSLWDQGMKILDGRVNLDGRPLPKPGFFERRRLKKASDILKRAATYEPENAAPPLFIGKIAERLGDSGACVDWMRRANQLQPDNLIVVLELGGALGRHGLYAESAAVLAAMARSNPTDARIQVNLGLSLLLAGEVEGAIHAFEHVISLEPDLAVNRKLLSFAKAVATGGKPQPNNMKELAASI